MTDKKSLYSDLPPSVYRDFAKRTASVEQTLSDLSIADLSAAAEVHPDVAISHRSSMRSVLDELLEVTKGKTWASFKEPDTIPRRIPFTPDRVAPSLGTLGHVEHQQGVLENIDVKGNLDQTRSRAIGGALEKVQELSSEVQHVSGHVAQFQKG